MIKLSTYDDTKRKQQIRRQQKKKKKKQKKLSFQKVHFFFHLAKKLVKIMTTNEMNCRRKNKSTSYLNDNYTNTTKSMSSYSIIANL